MMTSKKRKYNNQRRSTQLTIKSRIQLFYYCLPAILFEFIPTWEPFKKSDWSFGSLQSYLGNEKSFKPIFSVLLFPETEWMRSTYVLRRPLFFSFSKCRHTLRWTSFTQNVICNVNDHSYPSQEQRRFIGHASWDWIHFSSFLMEG